MWCCECNYMNCPHYCPGLPCWYENGYDFDPLDDLWWL